MKRKKLHNTYVIYVVSQKGKRHAPTKKHCSTIKEDWYWFIIQIIWNMKEPRVPIKLYVHSSFFISIVSPQYIKSLMAIFNRDPYGSPIENNVKVCNQSKTRILQLGSHKDTTIQPPSQPYRGCNCG